MTNLKALPGEPVSPEGAQEGKNTSHLAAPRMQRLPEVSPATAQEAGHRMLVREQRSISKKWLQRAQPLCLPCGEEL